MNLRIITPEKLFIVAGVYLENGQLTEASLEAGKRETYRSDVMVSTRRGAFLPAFEVTLTKPTRDAYRVSWKHVAPTYEMTGMKHFELSTDAREFIANMAQRVEKISS